MPRITDKATTDTIADTEVIPFDGSGGLKARTFAQVKAEIGIIAALAVTNEAQLTAYVTAGIPRPAILVTRIADNASLWLIRDEVGSESTDYSAGKVKPTDYDGSTNAAMIEAYL
ncbi:hypothetical protein [Cerasicoccus arenae]|uniref:Uncharacterized protein n=1 Tax=Cerasicoccus arenae TaxID=424488 RepID=A0A8J3GEX9_9BACT|nr:hypothetical protein [Cerasicoccus arenae]MBK1858239.1 hypothetical protein [Cerasicoccus arenae]GHC02092.1 hypothetical protein GCM10007047_18260 [Cerasicoccus arenae]